jgi:hypothetical protein
MLLKHRFKYGGKFLGLVNKSATTTHNVIGISLSVYEFSSHEQLAWNELPSKSKHICSTFTEGQRKTTDPCM